MSRTLCTEMDEWLEERTMLAGVVRGSRMPGAAVIGDRDLDAVPPCPLNAAEMAWLWSRYQQCSFPPATFAKRFARTDFAKLTPRGKNCAVKLAFKYRRQMFGKHAADWAEQFFLERVREAAAKGESDAPC